MNKAILLVASLAALLLFLRADLPVHCEFPQVKGRWVFTVTEAKYSFDASKTICALRQTLPKDGNVKEITIDLQGPNVAKVVSSSDGENLKDGTWTLIYDQGFDVQIAGKSYFAFFNYTEDAHGTVTSYCDSTFTGSYRNAYTLAPGHFGCFRARKVASDDVAAAPRPHQYKLSDYAVPASMKQTPFKNNRDVITVINKSQKSWVAGVYPQFEKMTEAEVLRMTGTPTPAFRLHHRSQHKKYMQENYKQKVEVSKVRDIPESFDWRNVQGQSFVSPVRNQKSCGSCYAFAATAMYEARTRVQSKNLLQPVYSTQDIVDCNPYSQGCDGGFAYLVSRYGQEVGIAIEQCYPYTANDTQCQPRESCPYARDKVSDISYIGGYYGATTAELMQQDILENGPMAVSFMVYGDFRYYKGGVYHHVTATDGMEGPDPKFVITNHVVLITGWGVLNGEPYWMVKNSWGDSWGLQGYFMIKRGTDEVGIESETITAKMVLYD